MLLFGNLFMNNMNPKLVPGFGNLYLTEEGEAFEKQLDPDDQEYFRKIPISSTSTYNRISVLVDGRRKRFHLHILMAVAFLGLDLRSHGTSNFSLQVDHKDNDKRNNQLDNLEIVTKQENLTRAWKTGCYRNNGFASKGSPKKSLRKFSSDDVMQIKDLRKAGLSYRKIAEKFDCNHGAIYQILKGHTYQDLN
jgi:hypothetical protein